MAPYLPLTLTVLLALFYLWMFRDMLKNERLASSPWTYFGIAAGDSRPSSMRFNWTIAFLFFNVFAAALYYLTEYRRAR
jgi:hypothetical protein